MRSGKEVTSKFEELVSHFKTFGCPVMIGENYDYDFVSIQDKT